MMQKRNLAGINLPNFVSHSKSIYSQITNVPNLDYSAHSFLKLKPISLYFNLFLVADNISKSILNPSPVKCGACSSIIFLFIRKKPLIGSVKDMPEILVAIRLANLEI